MDGTQINIGWDKIIFSFNRITKLTYDGSDNFCFILMLSQMLQANLYL